MSESGRRKVTSSPIKRWFTPGNDRIRDQWQDLGLGRALTRRNFLYRTGAAAIGASLGDIGILRASRAEAATLNLPSELSEGTRAEAVLDALPGKKPLIKLSYRPPNYETPIEYFRDAITPNDAFFVRYHLSDIPEVDPKTWRLAIGGEGANGRAEITLDDLKKMPAYEVVAVNLCSGNRRGLFQPHVTGVEWGYGSDGLRALEGSKPQGSARQGRREEGSRRGRLQRRRRPDGRQDARLHQEHSCLEGHG